MTTQIYAATPEQLDRSSCDWAFVDLGFSEKSESCGVLYGTGDAEEKQFRDMLLWLEKIVGSSTTPLNLVLEAPLSVAFNARGNPTGRSVERRGHVTRYWYVGLGAAVLLAATYVLRYLVDLDLDRPIRLVEGLASFKSGGNTSSHSGDVLALRAVAWGTAPDKGRVVFAPELKREASDELRSAFMVAGMDCGVPPVVALGA